MRNTVYMYTIRPQGPGTKTFYTINYELVVKRVEIIGERNIIYVKDMKVCMKVLLSLLCTFNFPPRTASTQRLRKFCIHLLCKVVTYKTKVI